MFRRCGPVFIKRGNSLGVGVQYVNEVVVCGYRAKIQAGRQVNGFDGCDPAVACARRVR